ncbi:Phage virion morphogenesis family protein [Brevinema andersonii]|uniref:Phage virion morphogenesis family protein n=1 Tax=Brevinema andersonii TaxID=34097 RepID=A0A1I1EMU5_BREAD|nr:phage virion morphogenesis protein [Brevinema andersonii]SFB88509.1 Phage virion morphogenesis family protein [Brevinema andersonii]
MVETKIEGIEKILEKLRNTDMKQSPVLGHALASWLTRSARMRILKTKTAPDGTKWTPLSPSTLRNLEKTKASGSLLYRTGMLHRSVGYHLSLWRKGVIILEDKMNYSRYLQEGTHKMLARPYLGVSKEDHRKLTDLTLEYLKKILGED